MERPSGSAQALMRRDVSELPGLPLCTGTERAGCKITAHLSKLNAFFWNARLELRKLCGTPAKLALVSIDEQGLPLPNRKQIRQGAALAHRLLKTHPCLAALDINTSSFKGSETLLRDALEDNASIKSFKIHFSGLVRREDFCSAIPSLMNLEHLEGSTAEDCPVALSSAITEALQRAASLRILRVPNLRMKGSNANEFFAALTASCCLEELSLHASMISEASLAYRAEFSRYVAATRTLTKLSVDSHNELRQNTMKWILEGLLENRTVTEVSLTDFVIDPESAAVMTEVLARNSILRRLNITTAALGAWERLQVDVASTADCSPWLHALAENGTLEAIALPLASFEPESWQLLFRALSTKNSLMTLTISGLRSQRYLWEKASEALISSGAEDNVSFETTINVVQNRESLRCRGFSQIYAFAYRDTWVEVDRTLVQISSLTHITSAHLEIWLPGVDKTMCMAIAHYISATASLRKLQITVWLRNIFREPTKECCQAICGALRQNASITELRVLAKLMDDDEVELLADAVRGSRNIRRVHLTAGEPRIAVAFVRRLRFSIEDHRNLVNVTVDGCELSGGHLATDLFVIHDTARRNADAVAWASDFVVGAVYDRYSACALERVARHPALQDELAEQLSVSRAEATDLVRRGLRRTQSMDDFMRLAGVVRERVKCHAFEDGRAQLDSLNEYCWIAIRRYLDLNDIQE
ncbi:uncharacterized protein LOC144133354 [Amblyomma americanum]